MGLKQSSVNSLIDLLNVFLPMMRRMTERLRAFLLVTDILLARLFLWRLRRMKMRMFMTARQMKGMMPVKRSLEGRRLKEGTQLFGP